MVSHTSRQQTRLRFEQLEHRAAPSSLLGSLGMVFDLLADPFDLLHNNSVKLDVDEGGVAAPRGVRQLQLSDSDHFEARLIPAAVDKLLQADHDVLIDPAAKPSDPNVDFLFPGHGLAAIGQQDVETIVIEYDAPFHGGSPPHTATVNATDFRLTMGGIIWAGSPEVKYKVSTTGCLDDCVDAVAAVNSGLDAWEVTGVAFTQDNVSPDTNPCTGSGNAVSWASLDGAEGTLAVASVCRNVRTKEIVGFSVTFDSGDTWTDSGDGDKFDIQAVMTHEAGHVIGLGHVNPPKAGALTMFPSIAKGDIGPRTLGCGDRLGVIAAYGTGPDCMGVPVD